MAECVSYNFPFIICSDPYNSEVSQYVHFAYKEPKDHDGRDLLKVTWFGNSRGRLLA